MFDPVTAIAASAGVGALGSIAGGLIGADASRKAANTAAGAAANNATVAQGMYNQTREDLSPWRTTGAQANGTLADLMGYNGQDAQSKAMASFKADPGYNFAFNQGVQSIDRSAAAKGSLFSGRTGTALTQYGQNLADQQYGNYWNRLMGMSGAGQNAAAQTGSFGATAAGQTGSGYMNAANMAGADYRAQGQAYGDAFSGVSNNLNSGLNNYYFMKALSTKSN